MELIDPRVTQSCRECGTRTCADCCWVYCEGCAHRELWDEIDVRKAMVEQTAALAALAKALDRGDEYLQVARKILREAVEDA